jgi:NADPH2:quinone reductase
LRALGADRAIDYRTEDVAQVALEETAGAGVDAVFDTSGGENIARSLRATRPSGRLACILPPRGELNELYTKNLALHGVFLTREATRLHEMTPLLERGQVVPLVEAVLELEDVAEAHRRLDSGHGRGKLVLSVAKG